MFDELGLESLLEVTIVGYLLTQLQHPLLPTLLFLFAYHLLYLLLVLTIVDAF